MTSRHPQRLLTVLRRRRRKQRYLLGLLSGLDAARACGGRARQQDGKCPCDRPAAHCLIVRYGPGVQPPRGYAESTSAAWAATTLPSAGSGTWRPATAQHTPTLRSTWRYVRSHWRTVDDRGATAGAPAICRGLAQPDRWN